VQVISMLFFQLLKSLYFLPHRLQQSIFIEIVIIKI
jgi:hypothetical protein